MTEPNYEEVFETNDSIKQRVMANHLRKQLLNGVPEGSTHANIINSLSDSQLIWEHNVAHSEKLTYEQNKLAVAAIR